MTESERSPAVGAPAARRFSAFAREHPGLVVSGSYLAATTVGMLSSWTFYTRFGINIFHYAQLSDFILVALRNPWASVAILAAFPAVWLIMKSDAWLERRFGWYKYVYGPEPLRSLSRSTGAWVLYLAVYAYVFALLYSGWFADRVESGMVPQVEAQLQSGSYMSRDATQPFQATLLGTTSAYVFLFDRDSGVITVVPLENLANLRYE